MPQSTGFDKCKLANIRNHTRTLASSLSDRKRIGGVQGWERPRPCKPDSVPPASRDLMVISLARAEARAPRIDGRSSGATITRGYHLAVAGQAARSPCSVLLRAGFAEPPGLPLGSGELLPPRFTLTFRPLVWRPVPAGGLFSVALSVTGDAVSPIPRLAPGALPCGVRTFLPIRFLAEPGG